jgi:hypothetical protein
MTGTGTRLFQLTTCAWGLVPPKAKRLKENTPMIRQEPPVSPHLIALLRFMDGEYIRWPPMVMGKEGRKKQHSIEEPPLSLKETSANYGTWLPCLVLQHRCLSISSCSRHLRLFQAAGIYSSIKTHQLVWHTAFLFCSPHVKILIHQKFGLQSLQLLRADTLRSRTSLYIACSVLLFRFCFPAQGVGLRGKSNPSTVSSDL